MKITFKKEKPETGLAAIGNPYPNTQIKVDGKQVGYIYAPTWSITDRKWKVSLAVKEGDTRWKWIFVKTRFDTEPDARSWVKNKLEAVAKTYTLHSFEDEDD